MGGAGDQEESREKPSFFQAILDGAFTSGLNVQTYRFLNGSLIVLVLLCLGVALASGDYEKASGGADIDLRFHFSAMAILALLLGMSLNYVISEAKVLKEDLRKFVASGG